MLHALAASSSSAMPGAALPLLWGLPFAGMLLSIAFLPLFAPRLWHHHFGKISAAWAIAFLVPFATVYGTETTGTALAHTLLLEYVPFIILLFTLFAIAGGIYVQGNLVGTPMTNLGLLSFGTLTASLIGTTGASMVLIRPVLRANMHRRTNVHVFVFFIFLVSNIGGSLTPLGDPPLFLGFLKGIDFLWTVQHMFLPMLVVAVLLLGVFFAVDVVLYRRERPDAPLEMLEPAAIRIRGIQNILYLFGVVGAVLMSGLWKTEATVPLLGQELPLPGVVRDVILLSLAGLSLATTRQAIRIENAFTWFPIREVATLFLAIFITIIPVLAILQAGPAGALRDLVALVTGPDGEPVNWVYFWLTGSLSSFLDNAPTYLVFFNLAGGDPQTLMGPLMLTLLAISCGAVFMGANTYIGNAPNFMVKAICEENGIKMPSFFGFILFWSLPILIPIFVLVTFLFFTEGAPLAALEQAM